MPFAIIVTSAGRSALINAENTGTLPVIVSQVGFSATAHTPAEGDNALPGEIKRVGGVSGLVVADDTIHVSALDSSADTYTARSIALYLADGTVFAIGGGTDPLFNKAAGSMAALAIDIVLADINAASVSFGATNFNNPPASTTVQGVVELATTAEAQAGIDALRALTPVGAKAAILGWLLTQDGAGSGLDADLLDGQDGAYYSNVAARLGFSPVNKAGDTMTGLLALSGAPTIAAHATRKDYVDNLLTAAALIAKILTVDGAGSGLDADLLDGQDGAYYANIAARLGFTPVNKAGDTMAGLLTLAGAPTTNLHAATKKYVDDAALSATVGYIPVNRAGDTMTGLLSLSGDPTAPAHAATKSYADALVTAAALLTRMLTVDGSGSGLDADLLDGQHGAWYTDIAARLGYTPLNAAGYTAADVLAKLLTVDGTASALDADLLDGQQGAWYSDIAARLGFTPLNAATYTAANVLAKLLTVDGSGSGVDADTVDGQHASAFQPALSFVSNASGMAILLTIGSDTLKLQWGNNYSGSDSWSANYDFPVTFTDIASIAIVSTKTVLEAGSADGNDISARASSVSQFQIGHDDYIGTRLCGWIALGK